MNSKLAACVLALALLIGLVFFLYPAGREGGARGPAEAVRPTEARAATELSVEEPPDTIGATEKSERMEARPVAATAALNPWHGELAGLTGRVVESNGQPVVGIRVALLEVDSSYLFAGNSIDEEEPSFELEETLTDHAGRFLLGGARTQAFHGLGIDLGGPRATLRLIDHALPHRERTDVGDVVLAPYGVLTGRVVDEAGAPIAGARIRVGPFPEEVLSVSPYEFRSESLIAITMLAASGTGQGIVELPKWVRKAVDRLPIPTTYSTDDGAFRLAGVALAPVVGGVDRAGFVGLPLGPIDMSGDMPDGERDLGELVLKRGRTIRGMVEDVYGEAVADVEVFAGVEIVPGVAAILQPTGKTDAEGNFELTGVAEVGQVVAISRRAPHEAWGFTLSPTHTDVLIELEAVVQLTVNVRDEAGDPLSGAHIQLTPAHLVGSGMGFAQILVALPKQVSPERVFREVEAGKYVHARVTAGLYDITARIPGLAPSYMQTECLADENEITLICSRGSPFELTVIDAVSKEPIVGARASVMRVGTSGFSKLAVKTTDEAGQAQLGPLQDFAGEAAGTSFFTQESMLLVQHPRYGDHSVTLESEVGTLVVELHTGGTLQGRVHWGGTIPTRPYMLILEYRGARGFLEVFHFPRFSLTDLAGEFRLGNLSPGKYSAELSERFLHQDPVGLIAGEFRPTTLHREELEIVNGETTELVIDLSPTGRGATARIVGRVRVDGQVIEGALVKVRGNESLAVKTDSWGRFETPDFAVRDSARVTIEGEVPLADGRTRKMQLHHEVVFLKHNDVHEIDLDLYPLTLRVQVLDVAFDEPVAEAQVSARGRGKGADRSFRDGTSSTDAAGEATLLLLEPGEYVLSASAPGFGKKTHVVEVPAGGLGEPKVLKLIRSVPCAGHVALDATLAEAPLGFSYIQVHGDDGVGVGARLEAPEYKFDLEGLAPGTYRTWIFMHGQQGHGSLSLGPDGERDLVLEFVPSED